MADVVLALTPATLVGIWSFGLRAALLIVVSILAAVVAEEVSTRLRGVDSTIHDMSAILTGLFLALVCPVNMPLWMAAAGSAFAIIVSKQIYGGVGRNPYNPALAGRAYLLVAYPAALTTWVALDKVGSELWFKFSYAVTDAITTATPLGVLKEQFFKTGRWAEAAQYCTDGLAGAFLGVGPGPGGFGPNLGIAGSLGEVSAIALLLGGIYLLIKGHITWHIPAGTLGGMMITGLLVYGSPFSPAAFTISFYGLFAGGAMIGAFFMATDMVTSPVTKTGRLYFGLGIGVLTVLIRRFGAYPEGMSFAVLLMNNLTPLIDHWTLPFVFGQTERRS
jgi:electron transport complex protein RnfD